MAVVPLSDASRSPTGFPITTVLIIAANAVCFALELSGGDAFVARWSVTPAQISGGHHLSTLFTAMYMHASWSHIIGNMVFLWAFGPVVEDAMNPVSYFIFYTLGGIVAMLCQVAIDPHSTMASLGASGAIAAVMGAFIVTYPQDRIKSLLILGWYVRITFIPAAVLIGMWFLIQLLSAGSIVGHQHIQQGGVAYMAHIGGMVFGAIFGRIFEGPRQLFK